VLLGNSRHLVCVCVCCVRRYSLAVDWSSVNEFVARTRTNDRLLLDQACLQWTPPVHSDDDDDGDDDAFAGQVVEFVFLTLTLLIRHVACKKWLCSKPQKADPATLETSHLNTCVYAFWVFVIR